MTLSKPKKSALPPLPVRQEEVPFYRGCTQKILRRYMRLSMEMGHLPSLVGTLFFRAKVSSTRHASFEDGVLFIHDVDRCLERLDGPDRTLISRVVLQDFTHSEVAAGLNLPERSLRRYLYDALDRVSEMFLRVGILEPMLTCDSEADVTIESCQETKNVKSESSS